LQQLRAPWRFTFSDPVAHHTVSVGDCLFGAEDLDDSPSHLRHYINRRVGVKLPQHSLLLHCFAAKILTKAEACLLHPQPKLFTLLKLRNKKELRQSKEKISTSFKKTKNSIIRWPECVPQLGLHATERKPKVQRLPQSPK
jgi:hypothetical protein